MRLLLTSSLRHSGHGPCPTCGAAGDLWAFELEKNLDTGTSRALCLDCLTRGCRSSIQLDTTEYSGTKPSSPKRTKRRSQRQEKELAAATGGRAQKGSGALPHAKGDVRVRGDFRGECKFTKARSYRLTRETLDKIRSECSYDETPIVDVAFVSPEGRTEDRWVAMPYDVWKKRYEVDDDQ